MHAGVVSVGSEQVDSHGPGPRRVEGDSREQGQRVVPRRGVENTVNLELVHHHHSRVVRKDVKTSKDAKLPKRGVKSHKF